MNQKLNETIIENPIIAAVNNINKLDDALKSPCEAIFLLCGSIFDLKNIVKKVRKNNKSIFVHIELLEGSSKDVTALKFIAEEIKPDGIITTKTNLIKKGKELGLFTIQRIFMIDSLSFEHGIETINKNNPHAVEVMPGIIPNVISSLREITNKTIITGGLVKNKTDVISSLKAGADGVSTSCEKLWYI